MTDCDVIVVGAGIFGQTIAAELRSGGADVVVMDDRRPLSGSLPSAGLMKPEWFAGRSLNYDASMAVLNRHFGVQKVPFAIGPITADLDWVPPAKVLGFGPTRDVKVTCVETGMVCYEKPFTGEEAVMSCRLVVVAAGVWSDELLPELKPLMSGKRGIAFSWQLGEGEKFKAFCRPWAPYKQVMAFPINDSTVWVGDGTAIKPENWTPVRAAASGIRCANAVGRDVETASWASGIRPFVKGHKTFYCEEIRPRVWAATGGGKTGMIGAGCCAHILREAFL